MSIAAHNSLSDKDNASEQCSTLLPALAGARVQQAQSRTVCKTGTAEAAEQHSPPEEDHPPVDVGKRKKNRRPSFLLEAQGARETGSPDEKNSSYDEFFSSGEPEAGDLAKKSFPGGGGEELQHLGLLARAWSSDCSRSPSETPHRYPGTGTSGQTTPGAAASSSSSHPSSHPASDCDVLPEEGANPYAPPEGEDPRGPEAVASPLPVLVGYNNLPSHAHVHLIAGVLWGLAACGLLISYYYGYGPVLVWMLLLYLIAKTALVLPNFCHLVHTASGRTLMGNRIEKERGGASLKKAPGGASASNPASAALKKTADMIGGGDRGYSRFGSASLGSASDSYLSSSDEEAAWFGGDNEQLGELYIGSDGLLSDSVMSEATRK